MGLRLMKNPGIAGEEHMIIMRDASGGGIILSRGENRTVLMTIDSSTHYDTYQSTDSGNTYTIMPSNFPAFVRDNNAVSFNDQYYYIGDPSIINGAYYIAQSNDRGNTWTYDVSSTIDTLPVYFRNIGASSDGKYILATSGLYYVNGDIWVSGNFGQSWDRKYTGGQYGAAIVTPDGQNMITGGYQDTSTLYSTDYGVNWSVFSEPIGGGFQSAMISRNGAYKVVWQIFGDLGGAIAYVSTDWTTWTPTALTTRLSAGSISDDGKYMLILSSDKDNAPEPYLNLSYNYGTTWTQIDTGSGNQYWSDCAMSADGKYMIAVPGTKDVGKAYKSVDYGYTWSYVSDIPIDSYISVKMSKSGRYVYLAGNSSGIIHSTNYMATWTQQFDASRGTGLFINF